MSRVEQDLVVDNTLTAKRFIDQPPFILTDGVNIALDASRGDSYRVTLAGNRTVSAPTNGVPGQVITINVVQDGVGGRTLAWDAAFLQAWSDTGNTAGKQCFVSFRFNGVNWVQLGQGPYV